MNADTISKKEYINRHLNFYAFENVITRGRILYLEGKVSFNEYHEKNDLWKFTVTGSKKYHVLVKGTNSQNIVSSCTCPYDWGSVCKHTVAALLYISNNLQKNKELETTSSSKNKLLPQTRTGEQYGYEITDYKQIDYKFIAKHASAIILSQLNFTGNLTIRYSVELSSGSITFNDNNTGSWVKFYKLEDHVYVTSPNAEKSIKLTTNEAQCLKMISDSPVPHLLDDVFSGKIISKQKEFLGKYGLPEDAGFSDYFKYAFSKKQGLLYVPTKKAEGLIALSGDENNSLANLLERLNTSEFLFKNLPKKQGHREMGFVLVNKNSVLYAYRHDYNSFDKVDEPFKIIPIIGKTRKNNPSQLATHIQEYELELEKVYSINKNENTENLLNLINLLNTKAADFELLKEAFYCLCHEKFVYTLAKNATKIRMKDLSNIRLSPEPVDVVFEVSKKQGFLYLDLKIKIENQLGKRENIPSNPVENYIFNSENKYYFIKNEKAAQIIADFPEKVKMVSHYTDHFFKNVVEPVSRYFEVRFLNGIFKNKTIELDFNKKQLFLSERDEYIILTPAVEYDNNFSAILMSTGNILSKDDDVVTEYKRNFELENEYLDELAELHPLFKNQKKIKQFYLHYSDFTKDMWFYRFFDQLQIYDVEVYGLKDLKNFRYSPYKGKINTSVTSGQDWFEVEIEVCFGDNRVSLNDIRRAVINKQRYIQLKDGSVGILPSEWLHKLERYFRNGEINNNRLEISKLRFSVIDELFDNIDDKEVLKEITEKRIRLKSFTNISQIKVPKQIKTRLRQYQTEGLSWMNFLDEMNWGGILADDMGLGKTLQVLAFLQQQVNLKNGANLVIVPTSLLFNWKNEIRKFAPKLMALWHYGPDRSKNTDEFSKYHLVVTTYGILVRDIEILRQYNFNYLILDESQAIKNPGSHRYKAACLIKARNKIALTGTPIENSTFDLYAQMNFANPGMFGSVQKFRNNYSIPVDKEGDELVAGELNKLINPFLLRRTKENVATELPDKTEDFIYCEMEADQRRVYDAYRNDYRNHLLKKIKTEGVEKTKFMVLEALTKLRQICDSPVLLNSEEISETNSVKIKELIRHITHKTGKHKILIFSQFVKMLKLIQDELSRLNIEYEYLDGKNNIKQREQSVRNFQENDNLRVFLISLKAGGTGLNLTAADYVFIVDPWWNPAVENQAIDRCHRIGQNKKVFAYRMICRDTIEEKILALQNKKKKIAGDIIHTDEGILKKLNKADIAYLFT